MFVLNTTAGSQQQKWKDFACNQIDTCEGLYYFAKRNETKRNETKRNETKSGEIEQN